MRILVFGDSISYGAWDIKGGWVERLKSDAHTLTINSDGTKKIQVMNLGIGGDTSTKILARMESEIKSRYSASWPFVFIFSYGANDERTIEGKTETSPDLFQSNTDKIISLARRYSTGILFVGAPPIGDRTVSFKGQEYSDVRLREYEEMLKHCVGRAGLKFVPIRPLFEASKDQLYAYDKLHPNENGHKLLYEAVKSELEEFLK